MSNSMMSNSGFELESLPSSYRPLAYSISSVSKVPVTSPSYRSSSQAYVLEEQRSRVVETKENGLITFYRSLSWLFGFKEMSSLILFFSCGGALLAYCLARASLLGSPIYTDDPYAL
ncbi:hypothetical protein BT96DRAFT_467965 [Gymnopus androsaceus JB14]|uniref:Uncharacterized protein n=1 Tax=Gymnopus androsaceus JB14 TaxID=1447944 RepID=A0A6A4IP41_9AGAR|nr:hypothetical protein BT96DRAFT_467965 [Gymnopus androsaceus JB14]